MVTCQTSRRRCQETVNLVSDGFYIQLLALLDAMLIVRVANTVKLDLGGSLTKE
jgi:hypothetical protein